MVCGRDRYALLSIDLHIIVWADADRYAIFSHGQTFLAYNMDMVVVL